MSDFKPYEDWTPEDEQPVDHIAALLKIIQLQTEQIGYLRTAIDALLERQNTLHSIAQKHHKNQTAIVDAIKKNHDFTQSVADVVKTLLRSQA
jgi:excinuclease UvrABC ATPase subunit